MPQQETISWILMWIFFCCLYVHKITQKLLKDFSVSLEKVCLVRRNTWLDFMEDLDIVYTGPPGLIFQVCYY